jgi:hypothetical protein
MNNSVIDLVATLAQEKKKKKLQVSNYSSDKDGEDDEKHNVEKPEKEIGECRKT